MRMTVKIFVFSLNMSDHYMKFLAYLGSNTGDHLLIDQPGTYVSGLDLLLLMIKKGSN